MSRSEQVRKFLLSQGSPEWEQHAADLLTEVADELEDYEHSFELYARAIDRGTRMWHEAGGNPLIWPDTGVLVAWLLKYNEQTLSTLNAAATTLRELVVYADGPKMPIRIEQHPILMEILSDCARIAKRAEDALRISLTGGKDG